MKFFKSIHLYLIFALSCAPLPIAQALDPAVVQEKKELLATIRETNKIIEESQAELPQQLIEAEEALKANDQAESDHLKWQNTLAYKFKIPLVNEIVDKIVDHFTETPKVSDAQLEEEFRTSLSGNHTIFRGPLTERQSEELDSRKVTNEKMPPIEVGIYNRNFFEGGEVVANLGANYYLFSQIYRARMIHVTSKILEKPEELLEWLTKLQEAKDTDAKNAAGKRLSFFSRKNTEYNKAYLEFIKYFKTYQVVQYNPFKMEFVKPILVNLFTAEFAASIKNKYILQKFTKEEAIKKYHKVNGTLQELPLDKAPASIMPFFSYANFAARSPGMSILLFPALLLFLPAASILHQVADTVEPLGKMLKSLAIPIIFPSMPERLRKALTSKQAELIGTFLLLGWTIKTMDTFYNSLWLNYVTTNSQQIIPIVSSYKKIADLLKKDPENKILKAKCTKMKQEIFKLITAGHSLKSIIPGQQFSLWLNVKTAIMQTYSWNGLFAYYAIYRWFKFLWSLRNM